jgi:hypothetical protein
LAGAGDGRSRLVDAEIGHAIQYPPEHAQEFKAHYVGADAAVRAQAEGHVALVGAVEIHLFRIRELGFVQVPRHPGQERAVARLQRLPRQFDIAHHGAAARVGGREDAEELL